MNFMTELKENKIMIYNELKEKEEYKKYRKVTMKRSVLALIMIIVFWLIMLNSNNSDMDSTAIILYGILILFTIGIGKIFINALQKPKLIFRGVIIDTRKVTREIHDKDTNGFPDNYMLTVHQYLVSDGENTYWAESTVEYTGIKKHYNINDKVYFFSTNPSSPQNSFILQ